jgi:4-carboxymuconolactone decarboxylase
MRFQLVCIATIALISAGLALAQGPKAPAGLHLRGDRFKPLTYVQMTPEQKTLVDHVLAGPRASMDGPFNIMLRSPEMGDLAQQLGAYVRFQSSLPRKLNEFAILITARSWNAQYEWYVHRQNALDAGLSPALIDAVAAGKRPAAMQPGEEAVYNFCTELLKTKQVSDATFAAAKAQFGERGVVDMTGVIGYYNLVSALLNVDRYPLPDGAKPELKPLP